jgi:SHS2 domain-containing protein
VFEHTADVGLRVRAPDLAGLFEEAARGLFGLVVAEPDTVESAQQVAFDLAAESEADLLLDWLSELIYTFETRRLVFREFDVRVRGARLTASAWGEPFDEDRHRLGSEVKAVTYHGLQLARDGDEWMGEVVLDI